jgi:hypothetical protein
MNTIGDAFAFGSGTSTSVTGFLYDTRTVELNDQDCENGLALASMYGSIINGKGYIAAGGYGFAITGVEGNTMTGYQYWSGTSNPPTPPPTYDECEADLDANAGGSFACREFTATNVTPSGPTVPTTGKLAVSLSGEKGSTPNTVAVTMTVANTGSSDISGLSFTDSTGL